MKSGWFVSLGMTTAVVLASSQALGQIVAQDYANDTAYNSGWGMGTDGGTGFGSWQLRNVGTAGQFINGDGRSSSINVGGESFGLFANGGGDHKATNFRAFDAPLAVGSAFHIKMVFLGIDPGDSAGFTIRTGNANSSVADYNNNSRFEFAFIGGDSQSSIFDGGPSLRSATGITFPNNAGGGVLVNFHLTGTDTYNVYLTRGASMAFFSRTMMNVTGGALNSIALYNRDAGQDTFYNSLEIIGSDGLIWNGGGGDNNSTTSANWQGNLAPSNGDVMTFAGNTRLTPNITSSTVLASQRINFASGAGPFVLGGDDMAVADGIVNHSSNVQTVSNKVRLLLDQNFNTGSAAGGALHLTGDVNTNGRMLTWTGANSGTVSGVIFHTGSLTKSGSGVLTLPAAVTHLYSGTTTVTAGTLRVDGSLGSGGATVTVGTGSPNTGILAGSGMVNRAVQLNSGGTVSPGNSMLGDSGIISNFTIGSTLTLEGGSAYVVDVNSRADEGSASVNWDHVTLSALTVNATSGNRTVVKVVSLTSANQAGPVMNWNPDVSQTWTIATVSGTVSGFDIDAFDVDLSAFENHNSLKANFYVWNDGGNIRLTYVPEPSTAGAVILAGLLGMRRRRGPKTPG